ncbi:MAG TPA: SRPBCC family protein [Blastocatellia bacterium]|nr:SRPBCC family protein [Blastocatellia bacterium]
MAISTNSTSARKIETPNGSEGRPGAETKGLAAEINGIRVEKSVIVTRDRSDLYHFWRNFRNLPQIMNHLEEVRVLSSTRSHWVAKAPVGTRVEWDAEITSDQENELIAWRSLEGATVANAGSVRFLHFAEHETEVRVSLEYDPPGGRLGAFIATIFGENPEQQITEDLARFKHIMESNFQPITKVDAHEEVI